MTYEGVLTKMQTEFSNPIQYYLVFENSFLSLNQLLGKSMEINFVGYQCLNCGKKKKIFRQGFCYDCFMSSAAAGDWIMKPELSTAHLDIEDRDLEYEKKYNCNHILCIWHCRVKLKLALPDKLKSQHVG